MLNGALFALVGVAFLAHWVLTNPGFDESDAQDDWSHVLGFSLALLTLAVALPIFARLAAKGNVLRASLVAATGAGVSSAANILEDGLQVGWAFFVFVAGTATLGLGLLALIGSIATIAHGAGRLTALVPAGTLAAVMFYVHAGGPIMLATWVAAAGFAVVTARGRDVSPPSA